MGLWLNYSIGENSGQVELMSLASLLMTSVVNYYYWMIFYVYYYHFYYY
jgi:hypothetical protein